MESAGVALALLPLMLNQLDNYVLGLRTLNTFRTRRYRQYLERYAAMLGGQHAMLKNTLGLAVGELRLFSDAQNLMFAPRSWNNTWIEAKLRQNLRDNYDVFVAVMSQASRSLEELAERLNWTAAEPTIVSMIPWDDPSALLRDARRIKHICSRSIYESLFNDLNNANTILKNLVDSSVEKRGQQSQATERPSATPLIVRQTARSVHRVLLGGTCWACSCQDSHDIRFILSDKVGTSDNNGAATYRLVITTLFSSDPKQVASAWQEVEVKHLTAGNEGSKSATTNLSNSAGQCGLSTGAQQLCADLGHRATGISDMCSALHNVVPEDGKREIIGYLSDSAYQHNIYLVKKIIEPFPCQTLEETLMSSASFPWDPKATVFTRRTRLQLAVKLAYSVLYFHGSWMRDQWRTRDIQFLQQTHFEEPCMTWGVMNSANNKGKPRVSSVIGCGTLFPLGVALIELSLCKAIGALVLPEDENPDEEVTLLKTAHRWLDEVYMQEGTRYGEVVKQCLFWSHTRDLDLDNEEHQEVVLQRVVNPLVRGLKVFDGEIY